MRLFRTVPAFALLFGARASSLDSRDAPNSLDVLDLLDTCGSINTELVVPDLLGILTAVGVIDVCLCLSTLPFFLETNVVAILGVEIAGEQVVTDILTNLINEGAASSNCVYPEHSTPACVNGNPCGFQCIDGFTPEPATNPTKCKCEHPMMDCNGKCVREGACPSHKPDKRRWVGSGSCAEMGDGWAACGVYGGGSRAWECVHTERDLESCGGCVVPLTAYSPQGTDCTALPGVADVECHAGECVVRRCLPGFVPGPDGTSCDRNRKHSEVSHPPVTVEEDNFVPARIYGLEHVPLERN